MKNIGKEYNVNRQPNAGWALGKNGRGRRKRKGRWEKRMRKKQEPRGTSSSDATISSLLILPLFITLIDDFLPSETAIFVI